MTHKRRTKQRALCWPGPVDSETCSGVVTRILYEGRNGYVVARLAAGRSDAAAVETPDRETVRLVGVIPGLRIGDVVDATGRWRRHPRYRREFMAVQAVRHESDPTVLLQSLAAARTRAHLASRLIPGIGSRTADRIVGHFGERTAEILELAPERLEEIHGLGRAKRTLVGKLWRDQCVVRDLMARFQVREIPIERAVQLYRACPNASLEELDALSFEDTRSRFDSEDVAA